LFEARAELGRGIRRVTVDAKTVPDGEILLMDGGNTRTLRVALG
jgi:hypothetical protein